MDQVTQATQDTPLSGWSVIQKITLDMVASTQNLTTLASAVPEIFQGV